MSNHKPVGIITGGTRGIGLGIAKVFLKHQIQTVLVSRSAKLEESLSSYADANPPLFLSADISKKADRENIIKYTIDALGRCDFLVNNAFCSFGEESADLLTDCFEKNLVSCYELSELAFPHLSNSSNGNIINISSASASLPYVSGRSIPYSISKAALNQLTVLSAKRYAPNIRVNSISPTIVSTERVEKNKKAIDDFKINSALERLVTPSDIGEMVLGLIKCRGITGQNILIDSGISLGKL